MSTSEERALRWLAAGCGTGWLPRAPGTWGSVAAGLLAAGWFLAGKALALFVLALVGSVLASVVCARLPQIASDPGWVVIDEWVGMWWALAVASAFGAHGGIAWLLALVAFRFLDIAKPWPVSVAERWRPPWWAVLADDLVAGLLAGLLVGIAWGGWHGWLSGLR